MARTAKPKAISADEALTKIHKIVGADLISRKEQEVTLKQVGRLLMDMADRLDKVEELVHQWMTTKEDEEGI